MLHFIFSKQKELDITKWDYEKGLLWFGYDLRMPLKCSCLVSLVLGVAILRDWVLMGGHYWQPFTFWLPISHQTMSPFCVYSHHYVIWYKLFLKAKSMQPLTMDFQTWKLCIKWTFFSPSLVLQASSSSYSGSWDRRIITSRPIQAYFKESSRSGWGT